MSAMPLCGRPLWSKHAVAAFVHTTAFAFLLGYAAEQQPIGDYKDQFWYNPDKLSWNPHQWFYKCVCKDGKTFCPVAGCSDSNKRFFVTPPSGAVRVNAIVLACVYVGWSAVCHVYAWAAQRHLREIKWVDYVVTAPTMLVVLGLSYSLDNAFAIVVAPIWLVLLLVAGAVLERRYDEPSVTIFSNRGAVFALLVAAYLVVVAPVLYGGYKITEGGESTANDDPKIGIGSAPDFVLAFTIVTVLIFSSFIVLYAYDGFVAPVEWRESGYITLSMIAKTTLHLFIGLTVIETARNVEVDEPAADGRSDMATLGAGLGGAAGLVLGLSILNYQTCVPLYDDSKPTE